MLFQKFNFPTTLIIFGVTGDLSRKKLLSSLFHMYCKDYLPSAFRVVGFSRHQYSESAFQEFVKEILLEKDPEADLEKIEEFTGLFYHQYGTFEDTTSYEALSKLLLEIDNTVGICMNKLFYLAVPPTSYKVIFQNLSESDLTIPCSGKLGWTRILVEKPFGRDLETAQELDQLLGNLFREKQIFRIDHYLAKETIQDILTFRFSNTLFEPVWNKNFVEKVEIKLWEDIDIASRGLFYDDIGALRDVGQNHILQMLALVAMDHPGEINADAIRHARVKVMQNLKLADEQDLENCIIRGQYEGFADGVTVQSTSETETYFKMKTFVDNERWEGVPFYIESGKAVKDKKVEITISFKGAHPCFCLEEHDGSEHQNTITLSIQPKEQITVRFWSKKPGMVSGVIPQDLSFDYSLGKEQGMRVDAYEKVLFDCIAGDQTLFASTDEISASWAFITPILKKWHTVPLEIYAKGSVGPERNWE
ncbi:MAG: glucose-6-phosphate dehydrogenase [Candidatus Peregrinibacteria bacterium]